MKTMDATAWLQMEALFEVTKEDKPIIIDQSRLIAMLDGYAEYRVKNFDLADVVGRSEQLVCDHPKIEHIDNFSDRMECTTCGKRF
jgi:hypothetical protein